MVNRDYICRFGREMCSQALYELFPDRYPVVNQTGYFLKFYLKLEKIYRK